MKLKVMQLYWRYQGWKMKKYLKPYFDKMMLNAKYGREWSENCEKRHYTDSITIIDSGI